MNKKVNTDKIIGQETLIKELSRIFSIFKANMDFKGLFIKEEEQQTPQQPVAVQEVAPKVESIMPTTPHVVQEATSTNTGIVDKEIEAKIWDMIIAKNLPGPDYIEFKNTAAGLVDIIPDESMQMKGAFNVIKRSYPSFTKEIILSSIDTYIGIVNEEKEKGLKESEEIRKTKIGDKTATINNMKSSAAEILTQIDDLKKKYDEINAKVVQLEVEVATATNEITAKENIFKNSVQAVINTLNADKTKVTNLNL